MTDLATLKLQRRVEQLLAAWSGPGSPGMTIGVVRGGTLIVHASAGQASIEHGVPVGPGTTFRIASVSKQFTCAAILMLAEEGRLRVDDDIRAHLPELPDFGARITIDHLMHNTSGLRDMLEIMRLGGIDLGVPVQPEELMAGIARQRTLNFAPGSRYLYSNSGFLLLGRIAERVSGEKLRDLLARRIFAPLGMNATRMVEHPAELVPGLATGYRPEGAGWVRAAHAFPVHGEGALVSSVTDLALWERSYGGGIAGRLALQEQMAFPDGRPCHYARGLAIAEVRGLRTVSHGGSWPGYLTEFLRIPQRDEAVIVINNSASANPYAAGQAVLEALLDGAPGVHPVRALPAREELARHAGRFVDLAGTASVDLELSDAGVLGGKTNGQPFAVVASADGRLAAARTAPDWTMALSEDGDVLTVERDAGVRETYRRVIPGADAPEGLAGTYRSAEMDATWTIGNGADGLAVHVRGPVGRGGPWPVEGMAGDIFRITVPAPVYPGWLDARVLRDEAGAVTGLLVNAGRVKQLRLERAA